MNASLRNNIRQSSAKCEKVWGRPEYSTLGKDLRRDRGGL